MADDMTNDPPNPEHQGLLDRLRETFSGDRREGDAPRAVNTDTPPLETHNRTPVDEPYPAGEMNATPDHPGEGTTDQMQIPDLAHPSAPLPPMGPDTLTGSRLTNMPTPRIPRGDLDPTDTVSGMYGGAEQGGARRMDSGEGEQDE